MLSDDSNIDNIKKNKNQINSNDDDDDDDEITMARISAQDNWKCS